MIDSPRNPHIQSAVALRDRKARIALGHTIVDGARECRRAVEAGFTVEEAYVCDSLAVGEDARRVQAVLAERGVLVTRVSERTHGRLAFGNRRDGIVLIVRVPPSSLDGLRFGASPLVLVTEDVEKPGNLGAILRTADAVGADAVIAVGGTDLFNPNVVRASVGTVFTVPLATAPAQDVLAWLVAHGLRPIAARVDAAIPYTDADLTGPIALVLGSESDGLSSAWAEVGIESVSLPMHGVADSLNVSAAAAILAFEARRQRDLSLPPGSA